jgi:hypothetical protein
MTIVLEAGLVGRDPVALSAFYTRVMRFALVERLDHEVGAVMALVCDPEENAWELLAEERS